MTIINLKEIYPWYESDYLIELPDEIAALFKNYELAEEAHRIRQYRYKAFYSLDCDDGIENEAIFKVLSPDEIYERKLTKQQLHEAISNLPDKQAKRVYAHYILGISKTAIAKAEKVSEASVRESIERGLLSMEKYLKKFF